VKSWPPTREDLRDFAALLVGIYIAIRSAEPPITVDDVPGFTVAAGFMGFPLVLRNKDER
jgi:hypothetical protein